MESKIEQYNGWLVSVWYSPKYRMYVYVATKGAESRRGWCYGADLEAAYKDACSKL